MKPKTTQSSITKNQILSWINSTLECNQTKIQGLGNGIVYCLLINHYYPNSIQKNKIIMVPKNNMDNKTNLKKVQEALHLLNVKSINFDIFRVSEMSYLDNWQLITKLFKHFQELQRNNQKIQKQLQKNNHVSQSQQMTNTTIHSQTNFHNQSVQMNHQILNPIQQNFIHPFQPAYTPSIQQNGILPKQITRTPDFSSGLLTPMKGLKYFDENTKLRYEALKLMQEIKTIVKSQTQSDKIKVRTLKTMLGLIQQQSREDELELKQLFSDCKKKQEVITID